MQKSWYERNSVVVYKSVCKLKIGPILCDKIHLKRFGIHKLMKRINPNPKRSSRDVWRNLLNYNTYATVMQFPQAIKMLQIDWE